MSLRRLLYHGAVYGLTSATARFLNWLLTPLYVHRLSVEDYGRLSELYSWMVFGLIATGLGMETAYFRFGEKDRMGGTFWKVLGLLLGFAVMLNVPLMVMVPFVSASLGYASQEELLWLTIGIWTIDALGSFALAYQRALGAPVRFAVIQLSHVGLFMLLNVWGVGLRSYGLRFILWANLFASFLRLAWGLLWGPSVRSPMDNTPAVSLLLRYGIVLAFMGLLGATNDVLDRVLLARYSLTETALYGAAYKAAMALALFVQAYRQAGEPLLLGRYRHSERFFLRSWVLYHAIALAGLTFLLLWVKPLLTTRWGGLLPRPIFPEAYHECFRVISILLWANLLTGSLIQASIWYKRRANPAIGILITGTGSLITWLGNLYGIPRFGYVASAWTTLAAYGSMTLLSLGMGYKGRGMRLLLAPLMIPASVAVLITAVEPCLSEGVEIRSFLTVIGWVGVGLPAYAFLKKKR